MAACPATATSSRPVSVAVSGRWPMQLEVRVLTVFPVNVPSWRCASNAAVTRSPIRTGRLALVACLEDAGRCCGASAAVLRSTTSGRACVGAVIAWRPYAGAVGIASPGACRGGATGAVKHAGVGESDFPRSSSVRPASAACLSTSVAIAACAVARRIWSGRHTRASMLPVPMPRASSCFSLTWPATAVPSKLE